MEVKVESIPKLNEHCTSRIRYDSILFAIFTIQCLLLIKNQNRIEVRKLRMYCFVFHSFSSQSEWEKQIFTLPRVEQFIGVYLYEQNWLSQFFNKPHKPTIQTSELASTATKDIRWYCIFYFVLVNITFVLQCGRKFVLMESVFALSAKEFQCGVFAFEVKAYTFNT